MNKTLGGILLIVGTQIGAGMLALPVTTGSSGFIGSSIIFILCFCYTLLTLFILLEVSCYSTNYSENIISMAKNHLGRVAEIVA